MTWYKLVEREGDFFRNVLLYESLEENFLQVFGRHHPPWLTTRQGDTFTHYHDQDNIKEFSLFLGQQAEKDPAFISRMVETGKQHFQELLEFCKNIELQNKKDHELAEVLEKYCILYKQPYPYFVISPFAEHSTHKALINSMGEWRLWARDVFNKAHELVEPLFEEISGRLHLSSKEIKFLTSKEIIHALKIHEKIECRQHCYFLFQEGKYLLKENESFIFEDKPDDSSTAELRGQGTFPTVVQGTVRIINTKEDLEQLQPGEIAVMRMTTPDLPLFHLKRAAAIITDEGGVTCHAAVISREFGIPCLMGTKKATKVLNPGDIIRVDTKKGIVDRNP